MQYTIGLDCGSRMTKICLFGVDTQQIVDCAIKETTTHHEALLARMLSEILIKNNLIETDIASIVCTGYGRRNFVWATAHKTEIFCHAKGVHFLNNKVRTIIDIGGQDTKIISVSPTGKVLDFVMNDKCAAGTGRFIEKVAGFFNVDITQLDHLASQSTKQIQIASTCAIFAETEMIGLIASGESPENIVNAVFCAIAHRIQGMRGSLNFCEPVAFVGGLTKARAMRLALEECLGVELYVPEMSSFTGAIGAAIDTVH